MNNNNELKDKLRSVGKQVNVLSKKIQSVNDYLNNPENKQNSFIDYEKDETLFNGDYLPFCGMCEFASGDLKHDCNFESAEKYLKSLLNDFDKKTNEYESFDSELTGMLSADGDDGSTIKAKEKKAKRKNGKEVFLDAVKKSIAERGTKKGAMLAIDKSINPEDKLKAKDTIKKEINKRKAVHIASLKSDAIKKYFDANPEANSDFLHWVKANGLETKNVDSEFAEFCGMCALLADGSNDKDCIKDGLVNYHEALTNFIGDIKNTDYSNADGIETSNSRIISFLQKGIVADSFANADASPLLVIDEAKWKTLTQEQKEAFVYLIEKRMIPPSSLGNVKTWSRESISDYLNIVKATRSKIIDSHKSKSIWGKISSGISNAASAVKTQIGQTSLRSHQTWHEMQDLKQLDAEQDKLEAKIDPLDARVENLVNSLETNKDNETEFDKAEDEADAKSAEIDALENELKAIEAKIQLLIKQGKNPKALSRKYNRLQRQDARKKKRETKRAVKKALRAKYGRGSDYRNAKKQLKTEIKKEKLSTLQEYGGTFGHRVVAKVALSVIRNAFLSLVSVNAGNLATGLDWVKNNDTTAYNKILTKFYKYGGEKNNLDATVRDGASKKPLLGIKLIKAKSFDGADFLNVEGATVLAWITASSAILTPVVMIINAVAPKDKQTDIPTLSPEEQKAQDQDYVNNDPNLTSEERAEINKLIQNGTSLADAYENVVNKFPTWGYFAIGGTAVALLSLGAYFLFKK